jgi:hypothetical protein
LNFACAEKSFGAARWSRHQWQGGKLPRDLPIGRFYVSHVAEPHDGGMWHDALAQRNFDGGRRDIRRAKDGNHCKCLTHFLLSWSHRIVIASRFDRAYSLIGFARRA